MNKNNPDYIYGLLVEGHLDLMHLPSGAVAWLFDRPEAQVQAAEQLARLSVEADNPIKNATLLRADMNTLVVHLSSGLKVHVYVNGGYGVDGKPYNADGLAALVQNVPDAETIPSARSGMDDPFPLEMGDLDQPEPVEVVQEIPQEIPQTDDYGFDLPSDVGPISLDELLGLDDYTPQPRPSRSI